MKKKLKKIILLLTSLVIAINIRQETEAREDDGLETGFYVNVILPDNQRMGAKSYFNLLTEPGKEQTLEMEVVNLSDENKVLEVETATATTSHPGVTDYSSGLNTDHDDTLIYKMEDLITTESRIEIEKGETYKLKLYLKMPKEPFEGVLAGGITFREERKESAMDESSSGSGVGIINTFGQTIAILLRESENEIKPELVLNEARAGQNNAKNAFTANIQNIQPAYVTSMECDAWITKKGREEKLYEYQDSALEMAPNSNFDYLIYLDGDHFIAGDYTFTAEIKSSEERWTLTKDFTISPEEARELNAADMNSEEDNLWLFILSGVIIFMLLTAILLVKRSKKKKKEQQVRMLIAQRRR